MKTYFGIENIKLDRPLALALGNFDGVHLGHQKLIRACIDEAKARNWVSSVLTFDPHPLKLLRAEQAPKLLTSWEQKADIFEDLGIDLLLITQFTQEISAWTPEHFVDEILVNKLHVASVFIGYNYTFGRKASGTPELLKKLGQERGFEVNVTAPVTVEGDIVSSTLVRHYFQKGEIDAVKKLTGRWPSISGRVVRGDNRGAKLGYPTANIQYDSEMAVPATGVYAALVQVGGQNFQAVVNIGNVPTFYHDHSLTVEAHLFNFNSDIYGQEIIITLVKRLRGEKKFDCVDDLVAQIGLDAALAQEILSQIDA